MITIQIPNIEQIRAAFAKSPISMKRNLNDAIKKTVLNIQNKESFEYKSLGIHVITGGLINSIRRGIWYGDLKAEVGPNVQGSDGVPYAGFVHEGTRLMRGRPWLLQAVQSGQQDTDRYFVDAVDKTLDEIASAS